MNTLFALKDPLVVYATSADKKICKDLDCANSGKCTCSECLCCTVCASQCTCSEATLDADQKVAEILGFGDWAYR